MTIKKDIEMAKRANVEKYIGVIESANALHTRFKEYEAQYVHRAHEELYALLANILRYVRETLENKDAEAVIRAVRKQLKVVYNIKTTRKTDDVGVLLRLVLRGAHRKTLHTYGRVIKQALNNSVSAEELAGYIKDNGGIEKLRAGAIETQTQAANDKQQQFSSLHLSRFAADLLNETAKKPIATFEVDDALSSRMHDTANKCQFRYMVCTYDGKYNVVDMVPMDRELEEQLLVRIAHRTSDLEYFMSDEELSTFERVKKEYAQKAGIKAKPSKYAGRLTAENDDSVGMKKIETAA